MNKEDERANLFRKKLIDMEAVAVLLEQFRQAPTSEQSRAVADQLHALLPGLSNEAQQ